MHLVLVGTSHHRAPVELREQLFVSAPENPELVRRLAGENGEAVALSTCNRTELYVVDEDPEAAQERAFAELAALSGLSESEIAPSLYTLGDEAAAMHLFRARQEPWRTGSFARRFESGAAFAARPRSVRTRPRSPRPRLSSPSGCSGLWRAGGSSSSGPER
jgi:hypothetical protein